MNCKLGCNSPETQEHIFTQCVPLKKESNNTNVSYNGIFENVQQQKRTIEVFSEVDKARCIALKLLPGVNNARTHASPRTMQQT